MVALLLVALGQDLPERMALQEATRPPDGVDVEVLWLWTNFDNDLRIENAPGFGLDVGLFGTNHGILVGFKLGARSWETENNEDEVKEADVRVRQYLMGLEVGFDEGIFELTFIIEVGAFTYSGGGDRDAAGFGQFGLELGVRPVPPVMIALLGEVGITHSDFNRGGDVAAHHLTVGISASVRF